MGNNTRNKKKGVGLRYFEIGGVCIIDVNDLRPLFTKLCKTVKHIHYFQLATTKANSFNEFFSNLKPAQTNDLIVFDLKLDTSEHTRFNFFGGVKDVF